MPSFPIRNTQQAKLLVEIYKTGQLSIASSVCGLSVSAASRMLGDLRITLKDELYLRNGSGLTPTPRMQMLYQRLLSFLEIAEHLNDDNNFDPSQVKGTFRFYTYDNGFTSYLMPVLSKIHRQAPKLNFSVGFVPNNVELLDSLRRGDVDLVIFPTPPTRQDIIIETLSPLKYCIMVRKGHPLIKASKKPGGITKADLMQYMQIMPGSIVGNNVGRPWVKLAEDGASTLLLPYFNTSPLMLLNSDCYEWIPYSTAKTWQQFGKFQILDPPKNYQCSFTPHLFWSRHRHNDPLNQWIRSIILEHATHIANEEKKVN